MTKRKLYFSEIEDFAYDINSLISKMIDLKIEETKVWEAEIEIDGDYFFCKVFGEIGEKSEAENSCGKSCKNYSPRNGKSGHCKNKRQLYEPAEKGYILTQDGKLTPLETIN